MKSEFKINVTVNSSHFRNMLIQKHISLSLLTRIYLKPLNLRKKKFREWHRAAREEGQVGC